MNRLLPIFIIAVLLLSACAPVVTPAPPQPAQPPAATQSPAKAATAYPAAAQPTKQPVSATAYPVEGTKPAVTAVPTKAAAPSQSGKVVYKLVPGESKVSYEVGETFFNQNNKFATAIGVTTEVSGEITGDKANPPASTIGPISIDISQFKSDSSRRDSAIRTQWLESAKYPIAKFTPTKIEGLPSAYEEGKEYQFKVTGDLNVRLATRPVTFDVTAKLNGTTLTGKAASQILMSEFQIGPISIANVLGTEDKVKILFEFVARP
ncbi:MAG TPA: YceI family protein [Anaerolineaceae bacterium]